MDTLRKHINTKHQGLSGWTEVTLSRVAGTAGLLWKDGGDSNENVWEEILTIHDITQDDARVLAHKLDSIREELGKRTPSIRSN